MEPHEQTAPFSYLLTEEEQDFLLPPTEVPTDPDRITSASSPDRNCA